MQNTAIYNKGISTVQGSSNFSASFNTLSLAGSNILLTHTHTHTLDSPSVGLSFLTFAYARAKRVVTPLCKGIPRNFFAQCFCVFQETK